MNDLKVNEWNESYGRQENFIFYPKEEVVKFLNRYVKKRTGYNSFRQLLKSDNVLIGLDLGCGIGRNTILFEEFEMEGHGDDISFEAIKVATELSKSMGFEMTSRFKVLQEVGLPYSDNFFDFAISDSVLDSMEFKFAKTYLQELNRTVKNFVYLNLISTEDSGSSERDSKESVVDTKHELGTIQSYYNLEKINELIYGTQFKIVQLFLTKQVDLAEDKTSFARFHVVLSK